MEMNTTEKFYLSVDGIPETFSSRAAHHQLRTGVGEKTPLPKFNSLCRKSSPSPNRRLQNKTHSQHPSAKVSNVSKAGMGIIKTVRARWRRPDKREVARSSSTGNRHSSSDRFQKTSIDPLTALMLCDETRKVPLALGPTKPKNCRRIVVLGAPKAGKTNILQRFLGDDFEERYEPTTEDFHRKLYHIRGDAYQIDILDAAGERNFPAKRRLSILTGDIFLLVFSVDDRESFHEVCALRDEIVSAKTKLTKPKDGARVPIVICGNKVDLDARRVVGRSETSQILGEDAAFFETSAKEGTGLRGAFRAIAALGGLPDETGPSEHQTVSILAYQSLCAERRGRKGSRALGRDAPRAALHPLARRPSVNSDLQQVLGSSSKRDKPEKCHIQ
ncbi:GTP-binding protein Rhes [Polymixia lowei]